MSHMIKTHHSEARASATLHHPDPSVNREENLDDAGEFPSLVDMATVDSLKGKTILKQLALAKPSSFKKQLEDDDDGLCHTSETKI